jgi:hypothetical protein
MKNFAVLLGVLAAVFSPAGASDPAYVCSFCDIVLGLVEQAAFQVHLETALAAKCGDSLICQRAVKELVLSIEGQAVPESLCLEIGMCGAENCKLFSEWPVNPLPPQPPAWPIERRLTAEEPVKASGIKENIMEMDIKRDLKVLKPLFESALLPLPKEWGMWAHVTLGMANLFHPFEERFNITKEALHGMAYPEDCGHNITCHIDHIVDHKPIQDNDGDYFSMEEVRRLRGTDWRGVDCDDTRVDVYPGRRVTKYGAEVDHNCNGIFGHNDTGLYEDLLCEGTQQRGIVILGDSATAHFHIPPQWLTAQGWNFDQLLPDALNEIDQPQCSWGTGHVIPEQCPYQYPNIPNVQGVTSLYTKLRERNRCNHNDYQNIGVNGARVTSSMQLAEALARDPQNDHPLLVWFALIGNDICNGHPTFESMTKPDEFYTKAMETFTALDKVVPKNSYVVSLALFDGELLYQIMHNHVHPLGTKYRQAYDYMNCLEENPCWGWLNSNETVRRYSTALSDALNQVYHVSLKKLFVLWFFLILIFLFLLFRTFLFTRTSRTSNSFSTILIGFLSSVNTNKPVVP